MAKKAIAILCAMFIVTYICFPVLSVYAEDEEAGVLEEPAEAVATAGVINAFSVDLQDENCVSTFDELHEWLQDEHAPGETVAFTNTITVPVDEYVAVNGITLNTASHGLIIEGEIRAFNAKIMGEGVENPVVTIASGGYLNISSGQCEITATGADGIGGCALKIEEEGIFNVWRNSCTVRSEGEASVGINSEKGLKLFGTSIISDGTGIKAGGEVELFMCFIDANVPVEAVGAVSLDTCFVNEPIAGAAVIDRKIIGIDEWTQGQLYSMLALGSDIPTYLFEAHIDVILDGGKEQSVPVSWDTSAVDTAKAGKYEVAGEIIAPYDILGLDDEFTITATVEIVDTSFPVLYEIFPMFGGNYAIYFLYDTGDLSGLTLWRSDDGGTSWYDYTENVIRFYDDDPLILMLRGTLDTPVLLVFEVEGLGESKILRISQDDSKVHAMLGGDRNGGDRGENTLPDDKTATAVKKRTSTASVVATDENDAEEEMHDSELPAPAGESEAAGIMHDSASPVPQAGTAKSHFQQPSPPPLQQPAAETAVNVPEAQRNTDVPDTIPKTGGAVHTIDAGPSKEASDNTEKSQNRKPYSDRVMPAVLVSSAGLAGAGAYLGATGKLSLKALIKLLAGRL